MVPIPVPSQKEHLEHHGPHALEVKSKYRGIPNTNLCQLSGITSMALPALRRKR